MFLKTMDSRRRPFQAYGNIPSLSLACHKGWDSQEEAETAALHNMPLLSKALTKLREDEGKMISHTAK